MTIGVRGNVVLLVCLGRPSNCKHGEGLVNIGRSATCIYNCSMKSLGLLESPRERRRLDRKRRRSHDENVDLRHSES